MVNVGTVVGLAVIGALGIGGYALYQNRAKIGGALSRGIQGSITDPLGGWLDSLAGGVGVSGKNATKTKTQTIPELVAETKEGFAAAPSGSFTPKNKYGFDAKTHINKTPAKPRPKPPAWSQKDIKKISNAKSLGTLTNQLNKLKQYNQKNPGNPLVAQSIAAQQTLINKGFDNYLRPKPTNNLLGAVTPAVQKQLNYNKRISNF